MIHDWTVCGTRTDQHQIIVICLICGKFAKASISEVEQ